MLARADLQDQLRRIRALRSVLEGTQVYGYIFPDPFQGGIGKVWKACVEMIRGDDNLGDKLRSAEVKVQEKLGKIERYFKQHYCSIPDHIEERMTKSYLSIWAYLVSLSADWTPASDMEDEVDLPWPSSYLPSKLETEDTEYQYWLL